MTNPTPDVIVTKRVIPGLHASQRLAAPLRDGASAGIAESRSTSANLETAFVTFARSSLCGKPARLPVLQERTIAKLSPTPAGLKGGTPH